MLVCKKQLVLLEKKKSYRRSWLCVYCRDLFCSFTPWDIFYENQECLCFLFLLPLSVFLMMSHVKDELVEHIKLFCTKTGKRKEKEEFNIGLPFTGLFIKGIFNSTNLKKKKKTLNGNENKNSTDRKKKKNWEENPILFFLLITPIQLTCS